MVLHILNLKETDPVYKVYTEQKKWLQEMNWANEIYETRLLYSLTFSDQEIKAMSKRQWKSIVNNRSEKYVHSTLCEQAASASKTKMICQKQTFKQQQYILQLPAAVTRRAFEIRLRMLDIKMNYKNKYNPNLTCKICKKDDESLQHIFVCQCYASEVNLLNTDFDYTWIYGENTNKINTGQRSRENHQNQTIRRESKISDRIEN